jgi:hypothetical protein
MHLDAAEQLYAVLNRAKQMQSILHQAGIVARLSSHPRQFMPCWHSYNPGHCTSSVRAAIDSLPLLAAAPQRLLRGQLQDSLGHSFAGVVRQARPQPTLCKFVVAGRNPGARLAC